MDPQEDPPAAGAETHRLESDGAEPAPFGLWSEPEPARLGPYRVLRPLGRGGMGVVYLAEQVEPVRRRVAIKLVAGLRLDDGARRRFAAEQRALARLNHPNVARLYESGTTPEGTPYFVMELVEEGAPLVHWCDARRLGLGERLELFESVCEGVRHAHQKGLLHRDIKPGNVLVTEIDGRPVPKVIDFGVAEAFDVPLLTERFTHDQVVGTPLYLAPECLEARSDLDTRADVYALGLLLYDLVAGSHPFGDAATSLGRLIARIGDPERASPSACFARQPAADRERIAEARATTPAALDRRLRGELDWVAGKAARADRDERYADVSELLADIGRIRRQEPVVAGPPTRAYRARKWVRRHRAACVAAGLVAISLAAGGVAREREARRARDAARSAHESMIEAQQTLALLVDLFTGSGARDGATLSARELLARGAARLDGEALAEAPLVRARLLATIARVEQGLGMPREALPRARKALALERAALEPPHPDLAALLELTGGIELAAGELDAAQRTLAEAYTQSLALHGAGSSQVDRCLRALASVAASRAARETGGSAATGGNRL